MTVLRLTNRPAPVAASAAESHACPEATREQRSDLQREPPISHKYSLRFLPRP